MTKGFVTPLHRMCKGARAAASAVTASSAKKPILGVLAALLFASLVAVRCGVDPTASITQASAPAGAGYTAVDFDRSRPFVAQKAVIDVGLAQSRPFLSNQAMITRMLADLRTLSPQDQVFTRYFTLTNQWNGGAPNDSMAAFRNAVSKIVNSLSYGRNIVPPRQVDQEGTIFRIDLRAYGWSRGTWEEITRRDPYAFFTGLNEERELNSRTQVGRRAFVRADWFALNGLSGAIYDIVMRIPGNLRQLEFDFGVNADRDVQSGRVLRAGMAESGVSSQSRIVEVHKTAFGTYWKSFDFEPEAAHARRNIFEFPLDARFFGNNGFDFAAGEFIFQLPNGLSLYMLADNQGRRLEKALTQVVQDPVRDDAAVTNAVSCFRCHVKGMIGFQDEIRPHVDANAFAFPRNEVNIVDQLYAPKDQMNAQIAAFDSRYGQALSQLGFPYSPAGGLTPNNEPVTQLTRQFEGELPITLAAAELGLTVNQFQTAVQRVDFLARRMGNVNTGGMIKREVFEDNFAFVVRALGLGQPFFFRSFQLTGQEGGGDMAPADPESKPQASASADGGEAGE